MVTLEIYRKAVEFLAKNKVDNVLQNSGNEHALIIFENIFRNSHNHIRIVAGNLCNDDVSGSADYISAISDFLIKDGVSLDILLTTYDADKIPKSPLYKRLHYFLKDKKKINIKHTETRFYLNNSPEDEVHFCIGDNEIYRIETDIKKRKAICNFNDKDKVDELIGVFNDIFVNSSTAIEMDTLFN